ncbi:MAG: FimV/HubP family polar landmark protein [Pseudomonadota bacterium]
MAALLLVSGAADAAGLGRMSVMSSLGQPLRAEIELLSVPADEIGNVEAKIASPEAFRQARIDRSGALADIQMSVEKRANGQPIVRIASLSPVNDPFVDLLIELNWSSGRILREYTVLLDPARDGAPASEPVRMAQVPVTQPMTPSAAPAAPAAQSTPAKAPARPEAPTRYGPVKSGETLHGIAAKLLPPDVTLDMMMASLYQSNKGAFQGNANLLKQGAVLNVPTRDAVMRLYSPSQARKLLQEHASAWHEMQGRVADQAARNVAEASSTPAGKGAIVTARPEEKPAPATASKDVLKLSKGAPAKPEDGKSAQRIQSLEEEVAAKSRALQEAQDRVNQLERTVQDLQKLVALRAKEKAAPEPTEASGVTTPPPAATPAEPAAQPPKPVAPPKPAVQAPAQPPAEEPGFLSSLLASPLYLGGLVAALGLAALLWIYMVGKRRKKGLSDFEQSVMTGGDQFKTSIFKTGGGPTTQTGATTQSGAATDFSRLGLGNIDTHEVDPIAEAEVYMAYGRDAQAEEILKEALSKDPYRHEIVLKLLEIYATRQDVPTFETQASELYANLGDPASQIWQKAAEMGRKLDPANPLYRVYGEVPSLPETPVAAAAALAAGAAAASSFEMPEAMVEPVEVETEAPPAEAEAERAALDMTMDEVALDQGELDTEALSASQDDMVMQFDLPAPATEVVPDATPDATDQIDLAALGETPAELAEEFDLDSGLDDLQLEALGVQEAAEPEAAAPEFPAFGQPADLDTESVAEIQIPDVAESIEAPLAAPDQMDFSGLGDLQDLAAFPAAETLEATEAVLPETSEEPVDLALPELDFSDIDLDLDSPAPSTPEPTAEVAGMADMSEIDPDLLEEVNTKLDLARAYQEMGDREGAREILEEVLKEGDSKQKQEAERLIASL